MSAVGSILSRRLPENDCWDRVRVVGIHSLSADFGNELVLAPVDGFDSPITANADAIWGTYQTETAAPPPPRFETPPNEVTVRV